MTETNEDRAARIDELESRLALADHAILELSNELYRQQKKLNEVESLIEALMNHLQQIDAAPSAQSAGDDIPPHY